MKFQPTPPRDKIFAFQKVLKIIVSIFFGLMGCWNGYQIYTVFTGKGAHNISEAITPLFGAILFFGLGIFLYQNRSNNTQRYDDIPGYGP